MQKKYYGDHNDTQRLLSNRTGYETYMEKRIDYEDFIIKLNIHGCAGFEQYTASHLLEDYVTNIIQNEVLIPIIGMFHINRL